ncbi:MAG TPA: MgtC/SapB family protein, partial [Candidatus Limnocylindrales bacterium]|nr:MgtC/SapB family protein [Candidatus Limnocylindrales bacterium]
GTLSGVFDLPLQLDLSVRLIVAAALGLAVGFEREIHGHPAGLRTHMLVASGSALFTVLSAYGFSGVSGSVPNSAPIDPTRIAAQIVSGIGFLGAGAILKDGIVIRGLTTAASLWATSAVGMAAGAGEYIIAAVATATILVSLWPINALAERLHGTAVPEVQLRLSMERLESLGNVTGILVGHRLEIGQISTQRLGKSSYRADLAIRGRTPSVITGAIAAIDELEGVDIISTSQAD